MRRAASIFLAVGFLTFGFVGYLVGSSHLLTLSHAVAADDCPKHFPRRARARVATS